MARSGNMDVLTRFRYSVHIKVDGNADFFTKAGFQTVTSPRVDFSTNQYAEGGRHLNPHSITEGATFSPVTFRRGKAFNNDFYRWVGMVFRAFYGDKDGNSTNYRATIVIDHHDRRGHVVKKYILQNARPTGYIPASNFDSMDDSELSIETLTVEYEGFQEQSLDQSKLAGILGSGVGNLISGGESSLPKGFDGVII